MFVLYFLFSKNGNVKDLLNYCLMVFDMQYTRIKVQFYKLGEYNFVNVEISFVKYEPLTMHILVQYNHSKIGLEEMVCI